MSDQVEEPKTPEHVHGPFASIGMMPLNTSTKEAYVLSEIFCTVCGAIKIDIHELTQNDNKKETEPQVIKPA